MQACALMIPGQGPHPPQIVPTSYAVPTRHWRATTHGARAASHVQCSVFRDTLPLDRALSFAAALVIIASLASLAVPFARSGFPSGHDATAHITYTYLFDRALSQGQVPVRWVEWVRNGESQPLFNFYPPGLYYAVEIVHALGVRLSVALKLTVVLLWWLGALFMFAWLKPLGRLPAGVAAALFALSPYLILDGFVRAAYPELAAIALAPGLLWSVDRLIRTARVSDALLVAGILGSMLLCHLLSSLVFGPIVAAYSAYRLATSPNPLRRAGLLTLGAALGIGLATFYLLPSLSELHEVAIGRMTSGYSDYQQHFVAPQQWFSSRWGYGASVKGVGDELSFQIGPMQWLAIALATASMFAGWLTGRRRPHAGSRAFWLVAIGAAMFLMTEHSAALWRAVPALAYLQFPWRYFMVVSVGTAALAALLLSSVTRRPARALIAIAVVGLQYQLHHDHVKPQQYLARRAMNIDNPRWADLGPASGLAFIERGFTPVAARQFAAGDIGPWTIHTGDADVIETYRADDHLELDVQTARGVVLRINSHYFPGWRVWANGAETELGVEPRFGFMEVTLGPGWHYVEARFTNTPIRTAANTISAVSIGLLVVGTVWCSQVRFRGRVTPTAQARAAGL